MLMQLPRERVPYTPEEEQYIVEGVEKLGHRWRQNSLGRDLVDDIVVFACDGAA